MGSRLDIPHDARTMLLHSWVLYLSLGYGCQRAPTPPPPPPMVAAWSAPKTDRLPEDVRHALTVRALTSHGWVLDPKTELHTKFDVVSGARMYLHPHGFMAPLGLSCSISKGTAPLAVVSVYHTGYKPLWSFSVLADQWESSEFSVPFTPLDLTTQMASVPLELQDELLDRVATATLTYLRVLGLNIRKQTELPPRAQKAWQHVLRACRSLEL